MNRAIKICLISVFIISIISLTGCIKPTFQVVVQITPAGGGNVTGSGSYKKGEMVTLNAINSEGYRFLHWKSDDAFLTDQNPYSFKITSNASLEAVFVADAGEISIEDANFVVDEEGHVKINGVGLGAVNLIEVVIDYDPNVLSWEGSSCRVAGWITIEKNPSPGIAHIAISGVSTQINEEKELIRMYLLPKKAGISDIEFATYESEGGVFFETNYITAGGLKKTYPELGLKKGVITINEN
ncbi:hypothetical protein V511_12425 [Mesotoga sp. Brook.08.YT.4.2.5.1]|jgi:hypothetical protein|uniref:InlB B-repeat-containing protein n=1 Tax=unclassified Mesotoga TaxID=1184398 RepID=UPI000C184ECC|nr:MULTISPECIES: hypothetical protein [unclassified Mesotoga]RAM59104.1 hypothetical protein DS65_00060 [Mesotoga sp. SC_4PWL113PWK15]PNE19818.1 hypothetical protein V511_12425 [Mesotoga sp. Brook.08.YT.4.2.5.1]PVD15999.1 hypothetical protein V512_003480 [Mesotoga sp. Brook.08.105.5.1]RAO96944.1 hypothetical protein M388_12485 [Mesotoga sp. Brook.08.YT.4.2.5.4.]RDI94322.1 hypothetical protein Q502_00765 [Mesotoga sp. Brook.08.YT.4.2.5.2.]